MNDEAPWHGSPAAAAAAAAAAAEAELERRRRHSSSASVQLLWVAVVGSSNSLLNGFTRNSSLIRSNVQITLDLIVTE